MQKRFSALFDYSQVVMGSCTPRECAVTVLSSVVSSPVGSDHSIIDAGALALSKDQGPDSPPRTMGEIFDDYPAGVLSPDVRVVSVSQEHGRVNAPLPVGSVVRVSLDDGEAANWTFRGKTPEGEREESQAERN